MDLVIDANIVIAAIIAESGKTRDIIFSTNIGLFAPEFLLTEIEKHKKEIILKSGLSPSEFDLAMSIISSRIIFVPFSKFEDFVQHAEKKVIDKSDTEYVALSLKLSCPLWSNDKGLQLQDAVKVYTTVEILGILGKV